MTLMTTKDPGPTAFGAEMDRRRVALDLTWERLAEMTSLSVSGLRRLAKGWERKGDEIHIANPSKATALKVADALEWDQFEAVKLAGYSTAGLTKKKTRPASTRNPVTDLWPRLTQRQRDLVVEIVRQFAAGNKVDNRTLEAQDTTVTSLFSHVEP